MQLVSVPAARTYAEPARPFLLESRPALSAQQAQSKIAELFSTHPSLDKRLRQLSKISAQLGQH